MSALLEGSLTLEDAKKVVYIVDDEKSVASLMETLLLEEGMEVFVSYNGEDALAEVAQHEHPVDLFLIDVVLPNISGPDLAQELRKHVPGSAILFTSGYGDGAGAALRQSDPEAKFLPKPFTADELLKAVANALS